MTTNNPPSQTDKQLFKKQRSSNLELYRIICMLMIVAGHYVFNGGLFKTGGVLTQDFYSANSIYLSLAGVWGKTGINCFMMITGYFMCTSKITLRKFVKLMGQIYLYRWLIFGIFYVAGNETLNTQRLIKLIMPFWNITDGFTPCYIVFWLTIPFWTILVQNINKRQHQLLLILLVGIYTVLGSIPSFQIRFNYVTWFGVLFLIASYIRLYPHLVFNRKNLWGWLTLSTLSLAFLSIMSLRLIFHNSGYFFVIDCNKIFAVAVAICSFLWFKNMNIKFCKLINAFGAGTFGVLLIHSNSEAMRFWLWDNIVDVIGHYSLSIEFLIIYHLGVTFVIFIICNLIDQLRIATIEKWILNCYDKQVAGKADAWIQRFTK